MWIRIGLASLAGLVCGAALAVGLVFGPMDIGGMQVGPWRTNSLIGDPDASAMVRAVTARRGLLALNRTETIYFNATRDDDGEALREECTYRVGFEREPQARWWSLTLYAQDDYLAVNGDNAHSVTAEHAAASAEDPMTVLIAPVHPDAPSYWMSSHNAGRFALTLRLYQPETSAGTSTGAAAMPSIQRLSCETRT